MNITYPIICQKKDGKYFIDFYIKISYKLIVEEFCKLQM